MTKKWMSSNGWKIGMAIVAGLVAWTALKNDVDKWMKPAIAKNTEAIEIVKEDVVDVEKDIIGVKGEMTALRVQQKTYHEDEQGYRKTSDKKWAEILTAIEKRNDSP